MAGASSEARKLTCPAAKSASPQQEVYYNFAIFSRQGRILRNSNFYCFTKTAKYEEFYMTLGVTQKP